MNDGATHKGDEGPIYFSYAGPRPSSSPTTVQKLFRSLRWRKPTLSSPHSTSHAASFPCNFLGSKKRKENKRSSSAFLRAGGAESISGVRSPSALCALQRRTVYAGPVSGFCVGTALGMAEAGRPGPRPRRSSRLPAGWRWTPCRVCFISVVIGDVQRWLVSERSESTMSICFICWCYIGFIWHLHCHNRREWCTKEASRLPVEAGGTWWLASTTPLMIRYSTPTLDREIIS